ncbi:Hypothetical protein, partial CDS, partial [Neorhizobium galegae bv. orientalis]
GKNVARYLQYPAEATNLSPGSPFAIRKWELETLLALFYRDFRTASPHQRGARERSTGSFSTIANLVNLLRSIEDSESGVRLTPETVLREMHKIAPRQFEWQRNFATRERIYRFAYIYGQGTCAQFFQEKYALTISEFLQAGFLLFAHAHLTPWMGAVGLEKLGISKESVEQAVAIMSLDRRDFRSRTAELNRQLLKDNEVPLAYLPSLLRQYPLIAEPRFGSFIAPLPQVIIYRITVGLFYDIASGPQGLLTEANNRFEQYAQRLLKGFYPAFEVTGSTRYGPKKNAIDSPDILVGLNGIIEIVIECKATKLTYLSQYANDPLNEARKQYEQIAKGVAQLWRFFAHARTGLYSDCEVSPQAVGIVLTLDAWLPMSAELQDDVLELARTLVAKDDHVIETDMRRVLFCPMQDMADTAIISNQAQFQETLSRAGEDDFRAWSLREIRRKLGEPETPNEFPLDYTDVLPWMNTVASPGFRA